MRVRQDTAPHLFAVESETDSEQWYQVFANGRSEEHTSELQSPCNLVCRLILSEEHTSELQSPCNLVCRLLLEKKNNHTLGCIQASGQNLTPGFSRHCATHGFAVLSRRLYWPT